MRALEPAGLLLALAEGGQLGGDLLLDAAQLVQLVGGADQVDGHLGALAPRRRRLLLLHLGPLGEVGRRDGHAGAQQGLGWERGVHRRPLGQQELPVKAG